MDSNRVPPAVAAPVTIAGGSYHNVETASVGDVLTLHLADPRSPVDFEGTAEGDGTSYGPDGGLVGITILNARLRLEEDGKIVLTLPEQRVEVTELGDALVTA